MNLGASDTCNTTAKEKPISLAFFRYRFCSFRGFTQVRVFYQKGLTLPAESI